MATITTTTNTLAFQQKNEEAVKQFIMDTLDKSELPDGSLQDILKDGILLCDLITRFSPNNSIVKNEGNTKFAYQDNIGQFLRVAESLHIPQSDLFQTVDLLEGKRMQSVISCLLAIRRIMCERKVIPKRNLTETKKNGSTRSLLLLVEDDKKPSPLPTTPLYKRKSTISLLQSAQAAEIKKSTKATAASSLLPSSTKNKNTTTMSHTPAAFNCNSNKSKATTALKTPITTTAEITGSGWPPKQSSNNHHHRRVESDYTNKKKFYNTERIKKSSSPLPLMLPQQGGFVKSQVEMITTSNTAAAVEPPSFIKRFSSEIISTTTEEKTLQLPPTPTPSKSTPTTVTKSSSSSTKPTTTASKRKSAAAVPPPAPSAASNYKNSSSAYTTSNMESANRKASLKKMGSCAITVECDDGSMAVYALGKSIGKGQFGEVFGGLNMDTGEYVAIKRIRRNQMDCDDMNEVGLLKHLNNEHIVRYVGFCKDKEYLNIILEYVEMGSLHNNIKAFGKFPEKLAASYTYKILSGLHYLHSKDVIHCDLKAANILTTKTGSLKLTDFGVSLSLKMKDNENTGEPAGTPNWMAPEVIKFAGASDKSDIWSLGCTIVEMLTGKPPYAGMPSFAALYRIVEDDEPPIPKKLQLSEELTEFLNSCFRKNPQDRPTAYELMKSKWMEPYFNESDHIQVQPQEKEEEIARDSYHFLTLPLSERQQQQQRIVKKSKSDTCLELSDSETLSDSQDFMLSHEFVDYQTGQSGEKCYACDMQMKKLSAKSCQDCQLKFHPHCTNKAPLCTKYDDSSNITQSKSTTSTSSSSSSNHGNEYKRTSPSPRYTPLGPLKNVATSDIKKVYLPVIQQQQQKHEKQHFYKSEEYAQTKAANHPRRSMISSIMT